MGAAEEQLVYIDPLPRLLWGAVLERKVWHLFPEMSPVAVCGQEFDPCKIGPRRLNVAGLKITCCGTCLDKFVDLLTRVIALSAQKSLMR